jgi:hypothetical protein
MVNQGHQDMYKTLEDLRSNPRYQRNEAETKKREEKEQNHEDSLQYESVTQKI